MLESFDGRMPQVAETAFVHPTARVRGDVVIGDYSIIWPGVSITGDWGTITIGKCTTIEDNCVIHVATLENWENDVRGLLTIGDYVTIGHGAIVHGRRIGNRVLVGMNATILQEVEIGDECLIAAGAVVTEGMRIPNRSFVAGVPAEMKGELKSSQAHWVGEGWEGADSYYAEYIEKLRKSVILE